MIYIKLFLAFFKVGLFTFGGGYAMIPMIENEISAHGWMTGQQFADIIAISEMTPGPIAVNSATFVGYKTAGILGGALATLGVVLPSFIIILIIYKAFYKFNEHPIVKGAFYGIRPAVIGLIAGAAVFVSQTSIFKEALNLNTLSKMFTNIKSVVDLPSLAIMAASLVVIIKYKWRPYITILASGVLGIIVFYVLNL